MKVRGEMEAYKAGRLRARMRSLVSYLPIRNVSGYISTGFGYMSCRMWLLGKPLRIQQAISPLPACRRGVNHMKDE